MLHKFNIGASVHHQGSNLHPAASGIYKITRQLPVERDSRLMYRIKNAAESFERIAEEQQLSRAD